MSAKEDSSLLRDLPRLYRRDGGRVLELFVGVAQAFVDETSAVIQSASSDSVLDKLERRGLSRRSGRGSAATPLELRQAISGKLPAPRIWSGRIVERTLTQELIVRQPDFGRGVVLAWVRADLNAPDARDLLALEPAPRGGDRLEAVLEARFRIDSAALPAGATVQAVLLDAAPPLTRPIPGMRLSGSVFWESATGVGGTKFRESADSGA